MIEFSEFSLSELELALELKFRSRCVKFEIWPKAEHSAFILTSNMLLQLVFMVCLLTPALHLYIRMVCVRGCFSDTPVSKSCPKLFLIQKMARQARPGSPSHPVPCWGSWGVGANGLGYQDYFAKILSSMLPIEFCAFCHKNSLPRGAA